MKPLTFSYAKYTDLEADYMILQAENKELQAQLDEYDEIAAEYGIDGKTMLTLAKSQIRTAQDNIKLQEQLAASQRREKAAVEDIYKMTDGGECDICKHYNPDKNTCAKPFVPYDDCFEWRGPQDSEKGEQDD